MLGIMETKDKEIFKNIFQTFSGVSGTYRKIIIFDSGYPSAHNAWDIMKFCLVRWPVPAVFHHFQSILSGVFFAHILVRAKWVR